MIIIGMLLCFAVIGGFIWLIAHFLNRKQAPMMPYTQQPPYSYERNEPGYQPPQQMPETPYEGGQQYYHREPKPESEDEQPQVQYPHTQERPPQH